MFPLVTVKRCAGGFRLSEPSLACEGSVCRFALSLACSDSIVGPMVRLLARATGRSGTRTDPAHPLWPVRRRSGTMSLMDTEVPPHSVLAAWAISDPEPLAGGQGQAFRAGSIVLKPTEEPGQSVWLAEVLEGLDAGAAVRVVRPVRSLTGSWVVDGWVAWRWMEGTHGDGMWDEVLETSRRFHRAVTSVGWSPAMSGAHRWASADQVAWGEQDADLPVSLQPLLARLRPVDLPDQLIHGDLGGNVLFHDALPPAVIDVSPFWRRAAYADAIVVADAVAWAGAGEDLVERLLRDQGEQLLLRAVLFRVVADPSEVEAYQRVTALLEA